ncbi:MAG: DNA polymerase I [Alphaproteobacteria bacterium]
MSGHLVLIDGSGYIFRAFHALPPMSRPSDGTPVNAVFGYTKLISKIADDFDASHMAVVFDTKEKTFRSQIYAEYKTNRPPPPEDLVPQFSLVREATEAMGLPRLELDGYEADDIIATLAQYAKAQGLKVTILSTDKDLMQLVENDHILMYDSFKRKSIGEAEVLEKFGVYPNRVVDVQALAGDSSDNVPGVAGIGIKTAAQLINEYGDLENLLAHSHEIPQPKRREKLTNEAELARISYQLVTLEQNVPIEFSLDSLRFKPAEPATFGAFLAEQGFTSLLSALNQREGTQIAIKDHGSSFQDEIKSERTTSNITLPSAEVIENPDYSYVDNMEQLQSWISDIKAAHHVAIDTETTSLDALAAELVGISLCVQAGKACYIPLGHVAKQSQGDLLDFTPKNSNNIKQLEIVDVLKSLKPILESDAILKIGQNIKYDMHILEQAYQKYNIELLNINPIADTMVMSFDLHAGIHNHGMDELSTRYLGITPIAYSEITGSGKNKLSFAEVDIPTATKYAAEDADITLRLYNYFAPRLIEAQVKYVYEALDLPLITVLKDMEKEGIKVDALRLKELSADFLERLNELEAEIYQLAGEEFNIASPAQLGEILFDKMGFTGEKRSQKTKKYSTSAAILEKLAEEGHEFPNKILEYRQLAKLRSTYSEALLKQINPKTQRVHTNYLITGASTGRLASNEPNLQNIPIRTAEGRKIRAAFVCDNNNVLISADYSQVELRLLAHVAKVPALQQAFLDGQDIHAAAAHQVFGVALHNMDPMIRRRAKAINFGIVYGISAFGLARQLDISNSEAKEYIDAWFARFPEVRQYMEAAKEEAHQYGFVKTFMGRKVHIPNIKMKGPQRGFSERLAINAPIQGGAADIVKKAMMHLHKKFQKSDCKMLLQVHDELIFEAPKQKAAEYQKIIISEMENAATISVPLTVEADIGTNWEEAH